jgi:hypothetical protein
MDYVLLPVPSKCLFSARNTCSFHVGVSSMNEFTYREEWWAKRITFFKSDDFHLLSHWFLHWRWRWHLATKRLLTTRRYIPKDRILHNHRCENLKSYIIFMRFKVELPGWLITITATEMINPFLEWSHRRGSDRVTYNLTLTLFRDIFYYCPPINACVAQVVFYLQVSLYLTIFIISGVQ